MISSHITQSGVVINSIEATETADDIIDYIATHVNSWTDSHILWDMTPFDFLTLNSQNIRVALDKLASMNNLHPRVKRAILVDSDLGFGMMRMLQLLSDGVLSVEINVFKDQDLALKWLNREV